jgi:hypothetical protein
MADLEAYPIIRLDQIAMLEMSTLVQVEEDGLNLLNSLKEEEGGENNPMVKYLQRQVEQTRAELVQRNASMRILDMLEGRSSEAVDESRYAPSGLSRAVSNNRMSAAPSSSSSGRVGVNSAHAISTTSSSSATAPAASVAADGATARSVVSEVRSEYGGAVQHVSAVNTTWSTPAYKPNMGGDAAAVDATPKRPPRPRSGGGGSAPSSGGKGDITSRSESSTSPSKRAAAAAFYGEKEKRESVRGNNLSNNNPGDAFYGSAAKKRAEMMQSQNFGSMFVVQSSHQKVRFIPKKKTAQELYEESPEGIKEKERKIRRENAVKRLMELQEKRMEKVEVHHLGSFCLSLYVFVLMIFNLSVVDTQMAVESSSSRSKAEEGEGG